MQNADTPKKILAGFKSTAIWAFNRNVFGDEEFFPSAVTDTPLALEENMLVCGRSSDVESEDENNLEKDLAISLPSTSTTENISTIYLHNPRISSTAAA